MMTVQLGVIRNVREKDLGNLQRALHTRDREGAKEREREREGYIHTPTCQTHKGILHNTHSTWLTVVPTEPCSTICSILASAGSWWVAKASSWVFFCMSSIATSMGTRMIWREEGTVT